MGNLHTPYTDDTASRDRSSRSGAAIWPRCAARQRQGGAVAVMAAGSLILMLAFCGLALDIAQVYNRKMELQSVADAAALAAASQLNGTPQGITNARNKARSIVEEGRRTLAIKYNSEKIAWTDAAISFSASAGPDADWSNPATTSAAASGMLYAKVQTARLGESYGVVETVFIKVLSEELRTVWVGATSIAGRSSINVTPFAVCAMSGLAAQSRGNPAHGGAPANAELVEYGFRRGVSYDLMQLNPGGTSPQHFIVDPETPPGQAGSAANVTATAAAPYVCSGTLAFGNLRGSTISVFPTFPLPELHSAFNSRFGDYSGGLCNVNGAPPDANVKQYLFTAIGWMSTAPAGQAAKAFDGAGVLHTVADPALPPATATAEAYGPLWTYARAVPFASRSEGVSEPAGGYAPFESTAWAALYGPGTPVATGYPTGTATPYAATGGAAFEAPLSEWRPGVRQRRVLNIALLECPVSGSQAKVAGIGRFFMTVKAKPNALVAEFAGLAPESSLGGRVELYK